ncbi:sulfite exporter TauE/SafE family protein [Streptomyces mirabilis]|uniref:sulfite exporter TauE/SafE family protein n=1 Tax=Streptomyces sp. NPDC005388 TaxID=3156717 RepID=UPI0033AE21C0
MVLTLLGASAAAFALALVTAVAGFGGGVLLLPVFTALFGLRVAIPVLTLAQIASNTSRTVLNRRDLHWPLIGRFALGAIPLTAGDALMLAHAPLAALKRMLGAFLLAVVIWRRGNPHPRTAQLGVVL